MNHYDSITPAKEPYRHQKRAVNEAVDNFLKHGFHALFMEMGTGKTKTTIDSFMILAGMGIVDAMLVVAPKAICSVWIDDEIPKHMTKRYAIARWDGRATSRTLAEYTDMLQFAGLAIYVVNVEAFQRVPDIMRLRVREFMKDRKVFMAIDESSYIKSSSANRSKNVTLAGMLAVARTILTGTEISNTPLDLFQQYEFLKPGFWGVRSFFMFRARYAILEEAYGPGGRTFKKVVGFQRMQELMDRITPYCSRALKKDCLDLPEKIHVRINVDLSPALADAYGELKDNLMAMIAEHVLVVPNKISLFTKFRQITGGGVNVDGESRVIDTDPPKLQALLADLADTDEQAIVWAAFTHEIRMLCDALSRIAPTVAFYGENEKTRDAGKKAFQEGRVRFMVINPAAGAYGLDLPNCHLQYFYSRTLSPSQNWQAEDRIHRAGQVETCVYKTIVTRDTVDERIESLLEAKTDIRGKFQDMTIEDIIKLV